MHNAYCIREIFMNPLKMEIQENWRRWGDRPLKAYIFLIRTGSWVDISTSICVFAHTLVFPGVLPSALQFVHLSDCPSSFGLSVSPFVSVYLSVSLSVVFYSVIYYTFVPCIYILYTIKTSNDLNISSSQNYHTLTSYPCFMASAVY